MGYGRLAINRIAGFKHSILTHLFDFFNIIKNVRKIFQL